MPQNFDKDSNARLDYKFDWAAKTNGSGDDDWLKDGDTISTFTVTADDGITVDDATLTNANTSVTVWLTGGTVGESYDVTNHIVTAAGREDDRTIRIYVREA
jgi:hypothetical protein